VLNLLGTICEGLRFHRDKFCGKWGGESKGGENLVKKGDTAGGKGEIFQWEEFRKVFGGKKEKKFGAARRHSLRKKEKRKKGHSTSGGADFKKKKRGTLPLSIGRKRNSKETRAEKARERGKTGR